jgi:eukaryotic-like serine/threonine-protein kinase
MTERHVPAADEGAWETALGRFVSAWRRGERPDLDPFLPAGPAPAGLLLEMVHADLDYRLKAGLPARVEDYLGRFPVLNEPGVLLELLFAEYSLRRRAEPDLTPDEYFRRFPAHGDALRDHLAGESSTGPFEVATPPGPAAVNEPPEVPGYVLGALLDKGGMGIVYRARDATLGRPLAVKLLQARYRGVPDLVRRFLEEARLTAQLAHPGVPPVHAAGTAADGSPFLAMKLVKGRTLAKLLAARGCGP